MFFWKNKQIFLTRIYLVKEKKCNFVLGLNPKMAKITLKYQTNFFFICLFEIGSYILKGMNLFLNTLSNRYSYKSINA